jgi:hypothetical protein
MHWDPFRQMAPFRPGEEQAACFTPAFELQPKRIDVKVTDKPKS